MEEFLYLILGALTMGSLFYILVCVDSNSNNPISLLKRLIFNQSPKIIKLLFGNTIFNYL